MNSGDQVLCINATNWHPEALKLIMNFPKQDKIYTIRDIALTRNGKAILLEEIENPLIDHPSGQGKFEPNFSISRFRKIVDDGELKVGFHVKQKVEV